MIKAPFFATIIALIGCYEGFQVSGSAESVGRLTTLSVVEAIFLVIVDRCRVLDPLFHPCRFEHAAISPGEPIIRVRGLVNRFGAETVHDGLDLDVFGAARFSALSAASGSGKSVLLRTIIGLNRPAAGECRGFRPQYSDDER